MSSENLYSQAMAKLNPDTLADIDSLSQHERDLLFPMRCNGFVLSSDMDWIFISDARKPFTDELKGQYVSFFGPVGDGAFQSFRPGDEEVFTLSFERRPVHELLDKYRQIDENQAARIAHLLGIAVRSVHGLTGFSDSEAAADAAEFIARKARLGEKKSVEAITSAMVMYAISSGSLKEDRNFTGNIYQMAEAIREDPIIAHETEDLGESQVLRLRNYLDRIQGQVSRDFPEIAAYKTAFEGFPTVGAEFHFPSDAPEKYPNFWERLALLNMSQSQRGSYVQLSRNDRDVIEMRMNPSFYPITIANWKYMKLLLPELDRAFFTVTINRKVENDFRWTEVVDNPLLNKLRTLGMLSYASLFENVPPRGSSAEIDFGSVYLGQTVRLHEGKWNFSGNWGGGEGEYGQMGIYAGFGNNFPYLVYYLSMALANPNILGGIHKDGLLQVKTLEGALALKPSDRRIFFNSIQSNIESNKRLNEASKAGNKIIELLSSEG